MERAILIAMISRGKGVYMVEVITCKCGVVFEVDIPQDVTPDTLKIWREMVQAGSCDDCVNRIKQENEIRDKAPLIRETTAQALESIPTAFREYDKNKGNSKLIEWLRGNYQQSLYIAGDYRIGKTRAVCYAGLNLAKRGQRVLFLPSQDFARNVSRQWQDNATDPIFSTYKYDLVILDDLGKEKPTERTAEALQALIDSRYRDNKRIWITSNYKLSIISTRFGDVGKAMSARLLDICLSWEA